MLKFFTTSIFILVCNFGFAQDPHLQKPKSVDELLKSENPLKYKSITEHQNYLVIENLRFLNRKKIYIGEVIGIKDKKGEFHQDEIYEISDSTFTLIHYNENSNHFEYSIFRPEDVKRYYTKKVHKGIKWRSSLFAYAPLAYDWLAFNLKPWENQDTFIKITGLQMCLLLISNRDKFFKSRKINDNYRIRIFKSY